MKFGKRYDEKYDPKKNYVIMDDDSLTEQAGYKTNTELYDEMVRSGKILRAHQLGMSYEEYIEHEDENPFELRYEMDIVEQKEVIDEYKQRLQKAADERLMAQEQERANTNDPGAKNNYTNVGEKEENSIQNSTKNE